MLFAIHNLSSSTAFEVKPWDYEVTVPESAAQSKAKFVSWCQKPTTRNCHFSAVEGLDPLRRVSIDNPMVQIHGLVADYDAPCTDVMLKDIIGNSPTEFVPNWASQTFSGGGRLVWMFEAPVVIPNAEVAKAFQKMASRKLKLVKILPGFDSDAFEDPSRYYEKGRKWQRLSGSTISTNFVHQWMYEAGNKIKWEGLGENSLSIPMPVLDEEVKKRFPGRWEGPFADGSRGVRFWDPDADNTTAAVVRATGMQCFTGIKGFIPWSHIFGTSFVDKYQAERTGEIITNLFFDGRQYWRKNSNGEWVPCSKDDMILSFKVKYGLSTRAARKDNSSEVEQVLFALQETKSVTAALPFVHFPSGKMNYNGRVFLNTSFVECLKPSKEAPCEWGDRFPWLAGLLDEFFDPNEQLEYFLAWWKHFYQNGLNHKPKSGQALFIAGDMGVGKTLLSTAIVSGTVGGHVDASSYLLGEEKFTSHVVAQPIMSVDDTAPATSSNRHTRYSAMIKKITANRHHTYEQKFQKAGQVLWLGRVMVTCNLDPESVKLLPNVELSLLDKISLFRCRTRRFDFPEAEKIQQLLAEELPFFCNWLLHWTPPKKCIGNNRFGTRSYHEARLFTEALQSGYAYSFHELLLSFLEQYKQASSEDGTGKTFWQGNSTDLAADMSTDARLGPIAAKYTPNQIAVQMGQLESRGLGVKRDSNKDGREWTIPFGILEKGIK